MKIEGTHRLNAQRETVWQLLTDPAVLKRCTPGGEQLESVGENVYAATLNLGVGSVRGRYTGQIKLEDMQPPTHFKMQVEGKGTQGFVKGTGALELVEDGDGTLVKYQGEVQLGGPLAGIGQRMIQSSSKMMAGQFFTAIDAEVAALQKAEDTGHPFTPPKHGFFRTLLRYFWSLLRRVWVHG
jgi:hypothetical protein